MGKLASVDAKTGLPRSGLIYSRAALCMAPVW